MITAIDDTDVTDMELSEVVSLIKENKDKNIVLTVQREDEETPLQITVEVTDVELPAVFSEMLDLDISRSRSSQALHHSSIKMLLWI